MEVRYRRADRADFPGILAIERVSFPMPWSEDAIASELDPRDARRLPLVAECEGRIVGFAFVWVIADELHLVSLAVDPALRRHRIGQGLLDAALARPEAKSASIMTLEVRVGNEAALALYRRNGFVDIALRPKYYPDSGEDAIVMLKPLRGADESDPLPFDDEPPAGRGS